MGGFKVTSVSDLTRVLRKFQAGQPVSVEVYRAGSYKTLSVVPDERPREEADAVQPQQQPAMPESGSFGDWYDFYRDFFG